MNNILFCGMCPMPSQCASCETLKEGPADQLEPKKRYCA